MSKRERKRWHAVDYEKAYGFISLGLKCSWVTKELDISDRSFYKAKRQFQALPEEKKEEIHAKAKPLYEDRKFVKDLWFNSNGSNPHIGESSIPIIQKWLETMILRSVSKRVIKGRIIKMRAICYGIKFLGRGGQVTDERCVRIREERIAPELFTEEDGVQWILELKKRGLTKTGSDRLVLRNFLKYAKGIVTTRISGHKEGYGKRAQDFFELEEIGRIFNVIDQSFSKDIAYPLKVIIDFMRWTGTRVKATLNLLFTDFSKFRSQNLTLLQVTVYDKGRRRNPKWDDERHGVRWDKIVLPRLEKVLTPYLQWRRNNSESQNVFPFTYAEVKRLLKQVYEKALPNRKIHQPLHIWRHTFAMMMLRETDWNYEIVAELGGWDDTKTLKDCYGSPQKRDVANYILQLASLQKRILKDTPEDEMRLKVSLLSQTRPLACPQ